MQRIYIQNIFYKFKFIALFILSLNFSCFQPLFGAFSARKAPLQLIKIKNPKIQNIEEARIVSKSGSKILIVSDPKAEKCRIGFVFKYNQFPKHRLGLFNFLRKYFLKFHTENESSIEEFLIERSSSAFSRTSPEMISFMIELPNSECFPLLEKMEQVYNQLSYSDDITQLIINSLEIEYQENIQTEFTRLDLLSSLTHPKGLSTLHPGNAETLNSITPYEIFEGLQHMLIAPKTLCIISRHPIDQSVPLIQKRLKGLFLSGEKKSSKPSNIHQKNTFENFFVLKTDQKTSAKMQFNWIFSESDFPNSNIANCLLFTESLLNSNLAGTPGFTLIQAQLVSSYKCLLRRLENGIYKLSLQCSLTELGIKNTKTCISLLKGHFKSLIFLETFLNKISYNFFIEKIRLFQNQERPIYSYIHPLSFMERLHQEKSIENTPQSILLKYNPVISSEALQALSQILGQDNPDSVGLQLSKQQFNMSDIKQHCNLSKVIKEIGKEDVFFFHLDVKADHEHFAKCISLGKINIKKEKLQKEIISMQKVQEELNIKNIPNILYDNTKEISFQSEWNLRITHPFLLGFSKSSYLDEIIKLFSHICLEACTAESNLLKRQNGQCKMEICPTHLHIKIQGPSSISILLLRSLFEKFAQGHLSPELFERVKQNHLEETNKTNSLRRETLLKKLYLILETGTLRAKSIEDHPEFIEELTLQKMAHDLSKEKNFALSASYSGNLSKEEVAKNWADICKKSFMSNNSDNSQSSLQFDHNSLLEKKNILSKVGNVYLLPSKEEAFKEEAFALIFPLTGQEKNDQQLFNQAKILSNRILEKFHWEANVHLYKRAEQDLFLIVLAYGINNENIRETILPAIHTMHEQAQRKSVDLAQLKSPLFQERNNKALLPFQEKTSHLTEEQIDSSEWFPLEPGSPIKIKQIENFFLFQKEGMRKIKIFKRKPLSKHFFKLDKIQTHGFKKVYQHKPVKKINSIPIETRSCKKFSSQKEKTRQ